jgi:hypothetical protein
VKKPFGIASVAMGSLLAFALPAQTPRPASAILAGAEAQAQAGQRAIFVIFDASW